MRFKKLSLIFAVGLMAASFVAYARPALAHILAIDGNMAVTLHIDPNDNPTAGAPLKFIFIYDNPTGSFNASQCLCTMSLIDSAGQQVLQAIVPPTGSYFGEYPYMVKSPGVYTVKLSGQPTGHGQFQPFNVHYYIRVAPGTGQDASASGLNSNTRLMVSLAAAVAAAGLILSVQRFIDNLKEGDKSEA